MSEIDAAGGWRFGQTERTPEQINALLFLSLAGFVVWGHEHPEVCEAYPKFSSLIERAGAALIERARYSKGIRSQPRNRATFAK
jgi:hypothetical protein